MKKSLMKQTIVLDLDETLIRAEVFDPKKPKTEKGRVEPELISVNFDPCLDGNVKACTVRFYIYLRPHVAKMLETLSQYFELGVFTSGTYSYM